MLLFHNMKNSIDSDICKDGAVAGIYIRAFFSVKKMACIRRNPGHQKMAAQVISQIFCHMINYHMMVFVADADAVVPL